MPEFGKRMDGVNGQRRDGRDPSLVPVVFTTLMKSGPAAMTNLSHTGAKLGECPHGREGDEAMIQVAGLMLMGCIVWARDGTCGVRFDEPLTDAQIEHLQDQSVLIPRSLMSPEEQLAVNDWQNGWLL